MLDYGICNVTYRLDKTERLLFELDYEVMIVTTQIVVNFKIIIKAIFCDKKGSTSSPNKFQGIEPMYALACMYDLCFKILGKL